MHQVNLSDQLYNDVQRRAAEAGFATVDEYVASILAHEALSDAPDLDHFFTPQRIEEIEKSLADADAGNVVTLEQSKADLAGHREKWLRENPSAQ